MSSISLQWDPSKAEYDDKLYFRLQAAGVLLFLAFAVAIPQIQLPEPVKPPPPPPPPLTELQLPEKVIPPPPKPEEKKPEPPKPEEKKPESVQEKPVEASKTPPVKPEKKPPTVEEAREVAEQSGLLALKDDLADLRQQFDADTPTPTVANDAAATQSVNLERKVIGAASQATYAKAQAAAAQGTIGRVALSDKGATNVKEVALAGLADKNTVERNKAEAAKKNQKGSGTSGRSEAQIRQILEANKSSLYTLYNRALRQNPMLKGKVVFELVITPAGTVSTVKIVMSELGDSKLERQLQLRLQSVQFGAAEVSLTRSQWTIEFLPG